MIAEAGRGLALAAAVAFVVLVAIRSWNVATSELGLDFYHFFAVPVAIRDGNVRDVYSREGRDDFLDYMRGHLQHSDSRRLAIAWSTWDDAEPTATPLQYAAFAMVSSGDYERDYRRFQAASMALGTLGLLLLGQLLRVPLPVLLMGCGLVALGFGPWTYDVALANVNRLMLFLFCAYLALRFAAFRHREWPALSVASGFVLGFVILFKPLLALAPFTLGMNRIVRRQFRDLARELVGGVVAAVAAFGAAWALFGTPRAWIDWLTYLPGMLAEHPPGPAQGNFAPSRWLADYLGSAALPLCGAIALGLLLAQFRLLRARRVAATHADALAHEDVAALGLALLLCFWLSPQVWLHYYVLTLPTLLFAFVLAWRTRSIMVALLAVAAAAAFQLAAPGAVAAGVLALSVALVLALRAPPSGVHPPPERPRFFRLGRVSANIRRP